MSTQAQPVSEPVIIPPETPELKNDALALVAETRSIATIQSAEQYQLVGEHAVAVAGALKRVHEKFDPACDASYKAWKAMTALRSELVDPLEEAKNHDGRLLAAYRQEQERLRKVEEDRLRRAAEDAERKRAVDEQLQQALDLEAAGDTQAAEQVLAAPISEVYVAPIVAAATTPQVQGVSSREKWNVEIVDKMAFLKAVVEGRIQGGLAYVDIDETKLRKLAGVQKNLFSMPGVRAYRCDSSVIRSGK